jgi:hypothetical protein
MNGQTMKLLVEYIAEQHRKERERYAQYNEYIKQSEQKTKEGNKK